MVENKNYIGYELIKVVINIEQEKTSGSQK